MGTPTTGRRRHQRIDLATKSTNDSDQHWKRYRYVSLSYVHYNQLLRPKHQVSQVCISTCYPKHEAAEVVIPYSDKCTRTITPKQPNPHGYTVHINQSRLMAPGVFSPFELRTTCQSPFDKKVYRWFWQQNPWQYSTFRYCTSTA